MSWRRRDPDDIALVEGSEAFLAGSYVELCESRGKAVPVWAWMNLLAHGTEDQLRAVTVQHHGGLWHRARRLVAIELVDLIAAGRVSLSEFQREVLVPLELDVMSCPRHERVAAGPARFRPARRPSRSGPTPAPQGARTMTPELN